jgi:hypothetical protein
MTDEEHHKIYDSPLPVHCVRQLPRGHSPGRECDEVVWREHKVKPKECVTLCQACHFAKHSIKPAVLKRDNFQCTECGTKADDTRLWYPVLRVHRLSGNCDEDSGPEANPSGFVTLCLECHEKRHPDRLSEALHFGGRLILPKVIEQFGDKLGIALPVTSKHQLAAYKEYLLVVNFFINHFRTHGVPKERELRKSVLALAGTSVASVLRRNAAEVAIKEIARDKLYFTVKEQKKLAKLNEEERAAYVRERKERHLDSVMRENAEPRMTIQTELRRQSVRI